MNLSSSYLGLDLRNPLVASAGPMTQTADRIERLAEAGVGAVVLPSLFEEQIRAEVDRDERLAEVGTDSFGEATSYLIDPDASLWPRQYLDLVQRAAKPGIPVIASLNGSTPGRWTGYAHAMQDAGAAAIELNIYYLPGDPRLAPLPPSPPDPTPSSGTSTSSPRSSPWSASPSRSSWPLLQLARRHGPPPGAGRRRRTGPVQPLHADRHRPRDPHCQHRFQVVKPGQGHPVQVLDRPAARPGALLARREHRRGNR